MKPSAAIAVAGLLIVVALLGVLTRRFGSEPKDVGGPVAAAPNSATLPARSEVPSPAVGDSHVDGGATVIVRHDLSTADATSEVNAGTRRLDSQQIAALVALFERADRGSEQSLAKLRAQPPSAKREMSIANNERSRVLRAAARAEGEQGRGFEVLDGLPPRSDASWYMYTLPSPGPDERIWVIPLSRAKYPQIGDTDEVRSRATREYHDDLCGKWNALPYSRRKEIVDGADAMAAEERAMGAMLAKLEAAGATQHVEYLVARRQHEDMLRVCSLRPLRLGSDYLATVGVTTFNQPPPDR
jgi:hypothetical protein